MLQTVSLMDFMEPQNQAASKGEAGMAAEKKKKNNCMVEPLEEDFSLHHKRAENKKPAAPSAMPPAGAQLTIFYNGSVSVYDAVTPEKAQAIMLIAAAASAVSAAASANRVPVAVGPNAAAADGGAGTAAAAVAALMRSLSQQSSMAAVAAAAAAAGSPPHPHVLSTPNASSLCRLQADLPIARRHSLQQFLEKRRSRLVNKAPYAPVEKSDKAMEVGAEGKPQPQLI